MFDEIKKILSERQTALLGLNIPEEHISAIRKMYDECIDEVDKYKSLAALETQDDELIQTRKELSQTLVKLHNLQGRYTSLEFDFNREKILTDIVIRYEDTNNETRPVHLSKMPKISSLLLESIFSKIVSLPDFKIGYYPQRVLHITSDTSKNFETISKVVADIVEDYFKTFHYRGGRQRSGAVKKIAEAVRPLYKYLCEHRDVFPDPLFLVNKIFKTDLTDRYLRMQ